MSISLRLERRSQEEDAAMVHATGETTSCGGCGTRIAGNTWAALPLAERIAPADVRRVLTDWPEELCIEVRCCGQCGREISRTRRVD
jgi:hypothetical protein